MSRTRTFRGKNGPIVVHVPDDEEFVSREFDDETKAVQLEHLAKIVSLSTIPYPSDILLSEQK